jgi:G:T-mismatch repair DNA endonuclease (very short patch repair protein)
MLKINTKSQLVDDSVCFSLSSVKDLVFKDKSILDELNKLELLTLEILARMFGHTLMVSILDSALPGTPDLVLRLPTVQPEGTDISIHDPDNKSQQKQIVMIVFVDGSYWHQGRREKMRQAAIRFYAKGDLEKFQFWMQKAEDNEKRDRMVNKKLKEMKIPFCRLKEERLRGRDPLGYVARVIGRALKESVVGK